MSLAMKKWIEILANSKMAASRKPQNVAYIIHHTINELPVKQNTVLMCMPLCLLRR
jgi:hypothetical protein